MNPPDQSRAFHRRHFYRVEIIAVRRAALVDHLKSLDIGARNPWNRELWRGFRKAPPELQARYERLCKADARYRMAAWY